MLSMFTKGRALFTSIAKEVSFCCVKDNEAYLYFLNSCFARFSLGSATCAGLLRIWDMSMPMTATRLWSRRICSEFSSWYVLYI